LVGAAVGFLLGKRGAATVSDDGELEKLKLENAK